VTGDRSVIVILRTLGTVVRISSTDVRVFWKDECIEYLWEDAKKHNDAFEGFQGCGFNN